MDNKIIELAKKHLKDNDPVIRDLINSYPFSLIVNDNYIEALIKTIIDQQLNVKVADLIYNRFKKLFKDQTSYLEILNMDDLLLRNIGLSYSKVSYLKDLILKIRDQKIDLKSLSKLSNQEVINELTKIKGIGIWSAQMFLIFSLARSDVLPAGDQGIKRAIQINYGLKTKPRDQEIEELSFKFNWNPYQSVASLYLWKSLKNSP